MIFAGHADLPVLQCVAVTSALSVPLANLLVLLSLDKLPNASTVFELLVTIIIL